jgi:hypothetical protein
MAKYGDSKSHHVNIILAQQQNIVLIRRSLCSICNKNRLILKDYYLVDKLFNRTIKHSLKQRFIMIDLNDKKLIYDQVMEYCKENNIRVKDFYSSIDITDVGFRKTWSKKNPQSIETLIDIIDFMRKNKKNV